MRRKKKSRLAAAEFLAVLIVTAVVFTKGLSAALAWRGYKAVGGEFMLLLLPIIYYEAKRVILDFVADFVDFTAARRIDNAGQKKRNRRRFAERRRGLVPEKTSDYSYLYYYSTLRDGMQGQKIERKARFYGLVWNINKPTIGELSSEGIT